MLLVACGLLVLVFSRLGIRCCSARACQSLTIAGEGGDCPVFGACGLPVVWCAVAVRHRAVQLRASNWSSSRFVGESRYLVVSGFVRCSGKFSSSLRCDSCYCCTIDRRHLDLLIWLVGAGGSGKYLQVVNLWGPRSYPSATPNLWCFERFLASPLIKIHDLELLSIPLPHVFPFR